MDDDELVAMAEAYAAPRGRRVAEFLGSGLHGMVCLLEGNTRAGQTALKVHRYPGPYAVEKAIYERLRERGILDLSPPDGPSFTVPRLLHAADELLAL